MGVSQGRNYGTILVDMATRRPVDLLPEAGSDALAAWLVRHPRKAQGFCGSRQLVRRRLQHWRLAGAPAEPPPTATPQDIVNG